MAESHAGEGHAAKAAELYLRSAEGQGQDHDSWGLSARFQAANAMTEGGFYDDARMTYSGLLRVTENENGACKSVSDFSSSNCYRQWINANGGCSNSRFQRRNHRSIS